MVDNIDVKAEGVAAPSRQSIGLQQSTAGDRLVALEGPGFQSCRLLAARLVARHRLATGFAVVYAECMRRGGR
jgi:hypothetical protein